MRVFLFSNVVPQKKHFTYICKKSMNSLDLIIVFPIAAGLLSGLFRGLIKEVVSLAVILLGIYLARIFAPFAAELLIKWFELSPGGAQPLGFIAVFSVVAILLTIGGHMIHGLIRLMSLGVLNSIAGGVIGALKVALLLSIIFNILNSINTRISVIEPELKEKSLLYLPVLELAPELWKEIVQED